MMYVQKFANDSTNYFLHRKINEIQFMNLEINFHKRYKLCSLTEKFIDNEKAKCLGKN